MNGRRLPDSPAPVLFYPYEGDEVETKNQAQLRPGPTGTGAYDVMDAVVELTPSDPLYATRHARAKVSEAMQKSYDLFFDPSAQGLAIGERLLVAVYACRLSRVEALESHYRGVLADQAPDAAALAAVDTGKIETLQSPRLMAMLDFTRKLILKPVEGDQKALAPMQSAGIATADIVTLAQLIAFLSYQIRVAAGLRALKAMESI